MKFKTLTAKSILTKSKLPDADYVLNPYTGCQFACQYCYASFMGRFVDESLANWGHYVYAKINAVELLQQEYAVLKPKLGQYPSVMLSSVTDPYQPCEKQLQLTQGLLHVLADQGYPGLVSVLTKSPLVLRDLALLQRLPQVEVGVSITTTDDQLSAFLEDQAPKAASRLETLSRLQQAGIRTYAFLGPLLPHFRYDAEALHALIEAVAATGVRSVYVEHINLKPYIMQRMQPILMSYDSRVQQLYRQAKHTEHRQALQEMVLPILAKHALKLRLNEVIYHNELA